MRTMEQCSLTGGRLRCFAMSLFLIVSTSSTSLPFTLNRLDKAKVDQFIHLSTAQTYVHWCIAFFNQQIEAGQQASAAQPNTSKSGILPKSGGTT